MYNFNNQFKKPKNRVYKSKFNPIFFYKNEINQLQQNEVDFYNTFFYINSKQQKPILNRNYLRIQGFYPEFKISRNPLFKRNREKLTHVIEGTFGNCLLPAQIRASFNKNGELIEAASEWFWGSDDKTNDVRAIWHPERVMAVVDNCCEKDEEFKKQFKNDNVHNAIISTFYSLVNHICNKNKNIENTQTQDEKKQEIEEFVKNYVYKNCHVRFQSIQQLENRNYAVMTFAMKKSHEKSFSYMDLLVIAACYHTAFFYIYKYCLDITKNLDIDEIFSQIVEAWD